MSVSPAPKTKPFPVRLTVSERSALEQRAQGMALGAYIKSVLFDDALRHVKRRRRSPVKDQVQLAEILACLGSSQIADNLSTITAALNAGTFHAEEAVQADLKQACADIAELRALLMRALGMQTKSEDCS